MYKEKIRYTKYLRQIKVYGNSNARYIKFEDEENEILTWLTTDYNKCSRLMRRCGTYSFTVEFTNKSNVFIKHVKMKD